MSNLNYEKRSRDFKDVSCYVLFKAGECIGNVNFKHPVSGEGAVKCYVHLYGHGLGPCGKAGGFGYDRTTAAFEDACTKIEESAILEHLEFSRLRADGRGWKQALELLGIIAHQAM